MNEICDRKPKTLKSIEFFIKQPPVGLYFFMEFEYFFESETIAHEGIFLIENQSIFSNEKEFTMLLYEGDAFVSENTREKLWCAAVSYTQGYLDRYNQSSSIDLVLKKNEYNS